MRAHWGPVDLTIGDPARTTRVPSGFDSIKPTVVAVVDGNGVEPGDHLDRRIDDGVVDRSSAAGQQSAATLLGLGVNTNARNLGIVQEGTALDAYLRTKATDYRGEPPTQAVDQVLSGPTHLVFTRTPQGATTLYVNGAAVATGTAASTMANWASTARLHLGGERDGSKPWLGTYYLVAMYDRALSPEEVLTELRRGRRVIHHAPAGPPYTPGRVRLKSLAAGASGGVFDVM